MPRVFTTDWLASQPVFYNELTGKASHNINDVIDFRNIEFHPEGLNNYLDFGYSILGQTPIKGVKFLSHSSQLTVRDNGTFDITHFEDPVEQWRGKTSHEDDVFHLLYTAVRQWEHSSEGEIIIPTSGGYDSRLLNVLVEDKSRIRSFTYGISENQAESFEVVYAKKLADILQTHWEHIPLGDFHLYFNDWDTLFGISTHAHGMYHIEFYKKILPKVHGRNPFLCGIFGDIWAGNSQYQHLQSPNDLVNIGYTHDLRADRTQSQFTSTIALRQQFWDEYGDKLQEEFYQVVWLIRMKIMLISYLMCVPQSFGFKPWSPFLIPEVALSMLTLPPERRKNRLWQKEFFQQHRLDLESLDLQVSYQNTLDSQAIRRIRLKPLNVDVLKDVIKPEYVTWINHHVSQQGDFWDWFWQLQTVPKLGGVLRRLGITENRLQAYNAYVTLKPIENLLKKANPE